MFFSKTYPVFEIGTIVSFERDIRILYGRVIGLHSYEAVHGKLTRRQTNQYLNGKWVMIVDSDDKLYSHDPYLLRRVENPNQVIEALKTIRKKERERGVPVDSQIKFLEQRIRAPEH